MDGEGTCHTWLMLFCSDRTGSPWGCCFTCSQTGLCTLFCVRWYSLLFYICDHDDGLTLMSTVPAETWANM